MIKGEEGRRQEANLFLRAHVRPAASKEQRALELLLVFPEIARRIRGGGGGRNKILRGPEDPVYPQESRHRRRGLAHCSHLVFSQ